MMGDFEDQFGEATEVVLNTPRLVALRMVVSALSQISNQPQPCATSNTCTSRILKQVEYGE
jgi:hypothetical protein